MNEKRARKKLNYFISKDVLSLLATVEKIDRVGLVCNKGFIQKLIQRNYDANFIAVMRTATTPQPNILISLFSLHFEQ